jgi:hypothetical protein
VAIALESGLEAAQAVATGLDEGDLSARRFARFAQRQRQRYRSFRRFVVGFYTPEFRDLFFSQDPPRRMFQALITVFRRLLAAVVATPALDLGVLHLGSAAALVAILSGACLPESDVRLQTNVNPQRLKRRIHSSHYT